MATKAERVRELTGMFLENAFLFRRSDKTIGVSIKSSPRRPSFTHDLDKMTVVEAECVGAAVTEVLKTLCSDDPRVKEYIESRVKDWDGKREKK